MNKFILISSAIFICLVFSQGCGGGSGSGVQKIPDLYNECGNGVLEINEECDAGSRNTSSVCSDEDYTCSFCSTECELQDDAGKFLVYKAKTETMAFDSYSFTLDKEGWVDAQQSSITDKLSGESSGDSLTDKFRISNQTDQVYSTYSYKISFLDGYHFQMKVISSDTIVNILLGAIFRYLPDENPDQYEIRTKSIPIFISRSVSENSTFLALSWHLNLMDMEALAESAPPVYAGLATIDGKRAYKIEFQFSDQTVPTCMDYTYSEWGIPEGLYVVYDSTTCWHADKSLSKAVYYIDAESYLIVQEEVFKSNGDRYYLKQWKDIEVDTLSIEDIEAND